MQKEVSIEDDAGTLERRSRCALQCLSRHGEARAVDWVSIESPRMGYMRRVVALWEPECTVSDDPV
eukprot:142985-Pleurochrysis_carterae.AAC.1